MILKFDIPCLFKDTYLDKLSNHLLIYNPLSKKGLTVLNQEATFLFQLIDGKRDISQIHLLAKQKDSSIKLADVKSIFSEFVSSEIIYLNTQKISARLTPNRATHLGVWLHLTNQCNLRCTYCYVNKTPAKMSYEIASQAINSIIVHGKNNKFKKITIKFSGGESLLEFPKIIKCVKLGRKLAKENNLEIDFVVLTNGVLLTENISHILATEKVRVMVSLDGLGKYNDAQRIFPSGLGTFKYIEKGIEYLQKAKVSFNVSITITSKNVKNIPKLTRYLLNQNIPFAFNFFRENPFVTQELENNDKQLIKYLKRAYRIIYDNPPRYSLMNGLLDRVTFANPHLNTCGVGNSYIVVRQDGKIVSCQMTLTKPIGSINDEDLIKTMKRGCFIKPKGLTVEKKTTCNKCQWRYICCGGCPLLTFKHCGNYSTQSPYCLVYRSLIPEVLRVEASRIIKYGFQESDVHEQNLPSLTPLPV